MEKPDLLIRFPNQEMTAKEYIAFCKKILQQLVNTYSGFDTIGIWSQEKKTNYNFDKNLTNFESIIFREIQIESAEYSFINEDKSDKDLKLDSKSYGDFAFSFGLSANGDETDEIGISIWAGDGENKKVGILNFTFPKKTEPTITFQKILPLLKVSIELVNPYYATIISNEFRRKVKMEDQNYWIGWINYFSNSEVAGLLPKGVQQEVLPNDGVIFWLSEEKVLSTDEAAVQKAIQIRDKLAEKGLLNYKL